MLVEQVQENQVSRDIANAFRSCCDPLPMTVRVTVSEQQHREMPLIRLGDWWSHPLHGAVEVASVELSAGCLVLTFIKGSAW